MRLTLATVNGAQVAPVYLGPRYRSVSGQIIDGANPNLRMTLEDAGEGLGLYRRDAEDYHTTSPHMRRLYRQWADELAQAIGDCFEQRGAPWRIDTGRQPPGAA